MTPAVYMWLLFSCTAHSFTKRYLSSSDRASFIFEVLSYINATSKLHKKESLFSWLYKISLWPTSFKFTIYREKRYFNTGVHSKNIKIFNLSRVDWEIWQKKLDFSDMNFVLPANLGKTNGMQNFVANHVISLHDVSQIQYHCTAFCVASWKLVIMFLKPLITWLYCKLNKLKSNSYRKKIIFVLSQKFDFLSVLSLKFEGWNHIKTDMHLISNHFPVNCRVAVFSFILLSEINLFRLLSVVSRRRLV